MTVLQPLPGSPGGIAAMAASLDASVDEIDRIAGLVRGLTVGGVWDGGAGEAFAGRLAQVGPVLQRCRDRYAAAAVALRRLVPEVETAQRAIHAAIQLADSARVRILREEGCYAAALARGDDVLARVHLERQRLAVRDQLEAESTHFRAWEDWRRADEQCAAALAVVADDAIADPALYRLLHATHGLSSDIAGTVPALLEGVGLDRVPGVEFLVNIVAGRFVPGLGAVTQVASWVQLASQAGLKIEYDEGEWRDLGAGVVGVGIGFGGRALKRGAVAGSIKKDGTFVNQKPHTTSERIRLGVTGEARATGKEIKDGLAKPFAGLGPTTPLRGSWTEKARQLADRARVAGTQKAISQFDDLRLAKAGGAVPMYAAGVTLDQSADRVANALTSPEKTVPEKTGPATDGEAAR